MIQKRLEVVGIVTTVIAVAVLVLGPGALWAAPVPSAADQDFQVFHWLGGWFGGVQAVSAQDECSQDPNGAQCADTAVPPPTVKRGTPERREWLSLCIFFDGFGCSSQPEQ